MKIKLLILFVTISTFSKAQSNISSSIGVYYSNNLSFLIKKNEEYKPTYGYNYGVSFTQPLKNKSLVSIGIEISRFGYVYKETDNPELDQDSPTYTEIIEAYGFPPYSNKIILKNYYLGIPIKLKRMLSRNLVLSYGTCVTYNYKRTMKLERISSDSKKTVDEWDYRDNVSKADYFAVGVHLGLGYIVSLREKANCEIGLDINMPSVLHAKEFLNKKYPISIGIKTKFDLLLNNK